MLAEVTYVFLYPVVYMASTSFKSPADLYDLTVYWIPTELYLDHYDIALEATNYFHSLRNSVITSLPAAIGQVLICSFVAYGFARIPFPGRNLMFLLVIFTFIVPPQTSCRYRCSSSTWSSDGSTRIGHGLRRLGWPTV